MYDELSESSQQRLSEVTKILTMLKGKESQLQKSEFDFVVKLKDNILCFGSKCWVSPKQLFWLRDIKEKYL